MLSLLWQLKQQHIISQTDYYFAKLIDDKQQAMDYPEQVKHLAVLLAALCNHSYQLGHSCVVLSSQLEKRLFNLSYRGDEGKQLLAEIQQKIHFKTALEWSSLLRDHIAFTTIPTQEVKPFVFQDNRLYLYRVWQDEFRVADYIHQAIQRSEKSAVENQSVFVPQIETMLNRYFPPKSDKIDWQKIAVATALRQSFCLISGGPGTGKTYTVARLLLALQELQLANHRPFLRITLTAPTGKAAARLTESIENTFNQLAQYWAEKTADELAYFQRLRQAIHTESQTLHRLLGVRLFSEETKFHSKNPLPLDVLVVDEASMVDLTMMAKLVQALKPQTRLILIGDKDQLSSVEAGAVLGELGQFSTQLYSPELVNYLQKTTGQLLPSSAEGDAVRDFLCYLKESVRFKGNSGIGVLAQQINQGESKQSWQTLQSRDFTDLELVEVSEATALSPIIERAVSEYRGYLSQIQQIAAQAMPLTAEQLTFIFEAFKTQRFLTALRVGEFGVINLNSQIAQALKVQGLVEFHQEWEWYAGKPVMITENDSSVNLYNGDIGLYLVDEQGQGRVWFELKSGQITEGKVAQTGEFRAVLPSRLPQHETAFAMTVHKSQGSEFAHTFFVLPPEKSGVLSKELVYTAVTRAKSNLTVFSRDSIWKSAVSTPTTRYSGLKNLLSIKNFT